MEERVWVLVGIPFQGEDEVVGLHRMALAVASVVVLLVFPDPV